MQPNTYDDHSQLSRCRCTAIFIIFGPFGVVQSSLHMYYRDVTGGYPPGYTYRLISCRWRKTDVHLWLTTILLSTYTLPLRIEPLGAWPNAWPSPSIVSLYRTETHTCRSFNRNAYFRLPNGKFHSCYKNGTVNIIVAHKFATNKTRS